MLIDVSPCAMLICVVLRVYPCVSVCLCVFLCVSLCVCFLCVSLCVHNGIALLLYNLTLIRNHLVVVRNNNWNIVWQYCLRGIVALLRYCVAGLL